MASQDKSQADNQGLIARGASGQDLPGTLTFVGGRLSDIFVQYNILNNGALTGIVTKLGGTVLPKGPALVTRTPLDHVVGLSPYRSILLGMTTVAALKQIVNKTVIMQEPMTPAASGAVAVLNTFVNTIGTLLFVSSATSASTNGEYFPQTPLLIGSTLFVAGIAIELGSELQRHFFKQDPKNKGKVYTGGLFSFSRHINYFGYTLWRTGFALASGGYTWAAANLALWSYDFTNRAIPGHQAYCEKKYGAQYEAYKQKTPYKFAPFIY